MNIVATFAPTIAIALMIFQGKSYWPHAFFEKGKIFTKIYYRKSAIHIFSFIFDTKIKPFIVTLGVSIILHI
jgi:hypothetical protein